MCSRNRLAASGLRSGRRTKRLCSTASSSSRSAPVAFSYTKQGAYEVRLLVDGTPVFCKATIPIPKGNFTACSRSDVLLGLVGSELPVAQQSIGGLIITSFPAKLEVTVLHDGQSLGSRAYEITYKVTPGPNGPNCEPRECKSAQVAFP